MARHIVKCRICKQQFDTEALNPDEWIMPNPKFYYHKSCYEDWRANKNNVKANNREADFWYETLIDYLYRDVKMQIDFNKLKSQWKNFTSSSKKMTPKGIYFAIKYYYDVQHGDISRAQGGIGIAQFIYNESAQYWVDLENKKAGTIEAILEQINNRANRPVEIIKKVSNKKKKAKWDLEDI